MLTTFNPGYPCSHKRESCTTCRFALTLHSDSFKPVINVTNNILGFQVIGLSHIAKVLVNYVPLATYNNIWVGFSTLWNDKYTDSNNNIRKCRKFMHYHNKAKYTHAIVSSYFNKPVKNWNATYHSRYYYNIVLSQDLVEFNDPYKAFEFLENNPKELNRIRSHMQWLKTPFVRKFNFSNTLLPFYGDFLNHIGSDKLNKNDVTCSQIDWLQQELERACQFTLGDVFDIVVSSGILGILNERSNSTLKQCVSLACDGNTGNKNTKLRIMNVLFNSGAEVPSFLIPFRFNFIEAAKLYYRLGADLTDPVDDKDNTVLHLACDSLTFDDSKEFFNWIITCETIGDVINTQNMLGETPLYVAISKYNEDYTYGICVSLINCMADVNIGDISGETPLSIATTCGLKQIQDLLVQSGAQPLRKKIKM